jgi:hypothetical protein
LGCEPPLRKLAQLQKKSRFFLCHCIDLRHWLLAFLLPLELVGLTGGLENAQAMTAHESPRTTTLYDRTDDQITLDEVERIRV